MKKAVPGFGIYTPSFGAFILLWVSTLIALSKFGVSDIVILSVGALEVLLFAFVDRSRFDEYVYRKMSPLTMTLSYLVFIGILASIVLLR